jgi:hypothetical protein
MSDEPSDQDQTWWMPPDRRDPAEQEDLIELGRTDPARPGGPISLRSSRRPYLLAGVAVAALLGGAGAAVAVTNTGTPAATPSAVAATPAPSPFRGQPGTRRGFRHFYGGLFGAVHGQFVIAKPGGGYQTVDVQDGHVTAVSTASITLKSPDGYTKSYAVASSTLVDAQRGGIGSVKIGNQASVLATVSGGTVTATSITDGTLLGQSHQGFGFGQGATGTAAQPG